MKIKMQIVAMSFATLVSAMNLANAGEKTWKAVITAREAVAEQNKMEAELRAEANAPGIGRTEFHRVMAVVNETKRREERETAAYEKFKMDQQLAIAQASAPKIYVINGGGSAPDTEMHKATYTRASNTRSGAAYQKAAYGSIDKSFLLRDSATTQVKEVPARFYKRQVLERSADRIVQSAAEASAAAANENAPTDSGSPFASPVQGKPGFVTSPPSSGGGMIDVRGYNPGSTVRDPYTGQVIRVP